MLDNADQNANTEQSIKSCYTVVYDFDEDNRNWKVAGNGGWSELHICQDESDGTFRVLAWTHDSQEVLVNCNLDHRCEYKEKSENFHSFKDENGDRKGFGFHKSERNLNSAVEFLDCVKTVLTELRRKHQLANPSANMDRAASLIQNVPILPNDQSKPPEFAGDGAMTIHGPRAAKNKESDFLITDPREVVRKTHVEFNSETGEYIIQNPDALPEGWLQLANKKFGVVPNNLPSVHAGDYGSKIPLILVQIKEKIKALGGLDEMGIFRLAPDAGECDHIKSKMNSGGDWIDEKTDVNVFANLLKVWFRDLPRPILNQVSPGVIELNQTADKVRDSMDKFPELEKALLMWLWDFCVEIQSKSNVNKMSVQNLGIVIGPNLFNTDQFQNPMKAMEFSGKVVTYFQKGVEWRMSLQSGEN